MAFFLDIKPKERWKERTKGFHKCTFRHMSALVCIAESCDAMVFLSSSLVTMSYYFSRYTSLKPSITTSFYPKMPPKAPTDAQEASVIFQRYRTELQNLAQKIGELESEMDEYSCVPSGAPSTFANLIFFSMTAWSSLPFTH